MEIVFPVQIDLYINKTVSPQILKYIYDTQSKCVPRWQIYAAYLNYSYSIL